jgi:hypothetical protein
MIRDPAIKNDSNSAFIFARSDFVNVVRFHFLRGNRFTITANSTAAKTVCRMNAVTSTGQQASQYMKNGACICTGFCGGQSQYQ